MIPFTLRVPGRDNESEDVEGLGILDIGSGR
jgi:hypothetical protein